MNQNSRYIIGIDLGTTNCAIAYCDTLDSDARPEVLTIPQLKSLGTISRSPTLASLVYYASDSEKEILGSKDEAKLFLIDDELLCGLYALEQLSYVPERIVHSAKSWLVHEQIDRHDAILPWGSDEIPGSKKMSALAASAVCLRFLRDTWNREVARGESGYLAEKQEVIITVPASFDEGAQRLTLEAAVLAGFLHTTILLEEPQAVFYDFLASRTDSRDILSGLAAERPRVLVCDIGGGTTDFSLFEFNREAEEPFRRLDVGTRILLGGDNIDLAIALRIEEKQKIKLSKSQRLQLLFQARWLKERIFSGGEIDIDKELKVSITGEGGDIFASAVAFSVLPREIISFVQEGFFPRVSKYAKPSECQLGLRELGLPYAADAAVTRHLASFLKERQVDAVLFNGGSLEAGSFRKLIIEQISSWQEGRAPLEITNEDRALTVARGAAEYGLRRIRQKGQIKSGYPRSVYLEVKSDRSSRLAVCVVPKGLEIGQHIEINEPAFEAMVGEAVCFRTFTSSSRFDNAGALLDLEQNEMHELPALETVLSVRPGLPRGALRVRLESCINELGMLELFCVRHSKSGLDGRWELRFNLRQAVVGGNRGPEDRKKDAPRMPLALIEAASERILLYYGKSKSGVKAISPRKLIKELEEILKLPRTKWDLAALRGFWPALLPGLTRRKRSLEHERVWFYLAGYTLRPGYGFPLDSRRILEVWKAFEIGRYFKTDSNSKIQWWIMWRRLAGGLDKLQQEKLYEEMGKLDLRMKGGEEGELLRLLGSLERINLDYKKTFGEKLLVYLEKEEGALIGHAAWALGRLGSRVLLYGGQHNVLPPDVAAYWLDRLLVLSRKKENLAASLLQPMTQIARLNGDTNLDIAEDLREAVIELGKENGMGQERFNSLQSFIPIDGASMEQLFGEALPLGLRML